MLTLSLLKIDLGNFPMNEAAWLGFRFDLRYVACIALLLFAVSFIPALHPFKHRKGKRLALSVYTFLMALLLVLYACDFLSQLVFEQRLTGQSFELATQQPDKIRSSPWVILALMAGVGTWLVYAVARGFHHMQDKSKSTGNTVLRMFWQGLTLVTLAVSIYGSFDSNSLQVKNTCAASNAAAKAFVINPGESVLFNP